MDLIAGLHSGKRKMIMTVHQTLTTPLNTQRVMRNGFTMPKRCPKKRVALSLTNHIAVVYQTLSSW